MMQYIRSFIFNIIFFIWMTVISLSCFIGGIFWGYRGVNRVGEFCSLGVEKLLYYIIGTTTDFRGQENIPKDEKYFVACKHQSAWETVSLHRFVPDPTVIMKKELGYLPLFGTVVKQAGSIMIDRKKGKELLPQMIAGAKNSFKNNRPVLIFPEGTRGVPGQPGRYRHGIFALYKALEAPVLPVALNSGFFWPRRGFLKKKGEIIVEFLPPIPPGLTEKEFMTKLKSVIEEASLRIAPSSKIGCPPQDI